MINNKSNKGKNNIKFIDLSKWAIYIPEDDPRLEEEPFTVEPIDIDLEEDLEKHGLLHPTPLTDGFENSREAQIEDLRVKYQVIEKILLSTLSAEWVQKLFDDEQNVAGWKHDRPSVSINLSGFSFDSLHKADTDRYLSDLCSDCFDKEMAEARDNSNFRTIKCNHRSVNEADTSEEGGS